MSDIVWEYFLLSLKSWRQARALPMYISAEEVLLS